MDTQTLMVFTTHPSALDAQVLAETLVSESLAACVNLLPQATSVYRWEDEIHMDSEIVMLIKTTEDSLQPLQELILAEHPYDCPEIIALPIIYGEPSYLKWLTENTR